MWPRDPVGGGTWIGVNDAGLIVTLLNGNPDGGWDPAEAMPGVVLRSRGSIAPAMLEAEDAASAVGWLERQAAGGSLSDVRHFRVVAADRDRTIDAVWDLDRLIVTDRGPGPVWYGSSGLGDSVVAPRGPLFEEMVAGDPTAAHQDAYHRHRWADRSHVSVLMAREAARTVSITEVEVGDGSAVVRDRAVAEDPGGRTDQAGPIGAAAEVVLGLG